MSAIMRTIRRGLLNVGLLLIGLGCILLYLFQFERTNAWRYSFWENPSQIGFAMIILGFVIGLIPAIISYLFFRIQGRSSLEAHMAVARQHKADHTEEAEYNKKFKKRFGNFMRGKKSEPVSTLADAEKKTN